MKTITELVSKSSVPEGLIRAVVHQVGGWEIFKMIAPTVTTTPTAQWAGFEYHTETTKFFTCHRDLIRQLAQHVATECGRSTISMVLSLHCLDQSFSEDEVGLALYGPKSKINTQIANALAWFALQQVAQAYTNAMK
jgi:hypothetical protein